MTAKKSVLEVTESNKKRIHKLAKKGGSSVKDMTNTILGWAIPHFEDGRCEVSQPQVIVNEPTKKGGK